MTNRKVAGVAAVEGFGGSPCDSASSCLNRRDDGIDVVSHPDIVGQGNSAETGTWQPFEGHVFGQFVLLPEHHAYAARLKEDGLLDFLPMPPEALVEFEGSRHVGDTQGNEADALLHAAMMSAHSDNAGPSPSVR